MLFRCLANMNSVIEVVSNIAPPAHYLQTVLISDDHVTD